MHNLPSDWETNDLEKLTTKAREYLATILSSCEWNKQQREIAKSKLSTKSTEKKKKKDQGGPHKTNKEGTPPTLEPYQKEILKKIKQGKHTAEHIAHWKEATTQDACYYHCFKHPGGVCFALEKALKKAENNGIMQGAQAAPAAVNQNIEGEMPAARRVTHEVSNNPFDILQVEDI
eukprot:10808043-Ditylum_brightwellii.AAC.1